MLAWFLAASLTPSPVADLEAVAAALRAAPAWEAPFTQRYLPAGFVRGTEETGTLLLQPPERARFEYQGRVFALRGTVARLVDLQAGTCEAIRLDPATLDRMPLAAILDPGATRASFQVDTAPKSLTLTPRRPSSNIARIEIRLGENRLPTQVVVVEPGGDRNEFHFRRWMKRNLLPEDTFLPALPGKLPCNPVNE